MRGFAYTHELGVMGEACEHACMQGLWTEAVDIAYGGSAGFHMRLFSPRCHRAIGWGVHGQAHRQCSTNAPALTTRTRREGHPKCCIAHFLRQLVLPLVRRARATGPLNNTQGQWPAAGTTP